jgi:hypothetical protein
MLDSDLQLPPKLIPKLLNEFERGPDVVYPIREDVPEIGWQGDYQRATRRHHPA